MGAVSLSVLMITNNEEIKAENLDQISDDIVIVDTKEKQTFGTHHFPWTDDFSEARNYAQSQCKGDYILWLDDDDEVPQKTIGTIKEMLGETQMLSLNFVFDFALKSVGVSSVS